MTRIASSELSIQSAVMTGDPHDRAVSNLNVRGLFAIGVVLACYLFSLLEVSHGQMKRRRSTFRRYDHAFYHSHVHEAFLLFALAVRLPYCPF